MNLSEYYNTVMELSHGIVITLDEKGRIIHGNSRFEALSGYEIGAVAGRDWFELCVDAKRRARSREVFAGIVQSGTMAFMKGSLRSKDGRKVYIDWNMKPLFDSQHSLVSVLCVGQDVTAHVQRQHELLHEHGRLVALNKELSCLHAMNRIVSNMDSELPDILREILAIIPLVSAPRVHGRAAAPRRRCADQREIRARSQLPPGAGGVGAAGETRPFERQPVGPGRRRLAVRLPAHGIRTPRGAGQACGLDHRQARGPFDQEKPGASAATRRSAGQNRAVRGRSGARTERALANILGFAQLAEQTPGLAEQVRKDLDSIIKAALHSREVIKKLMIFGRQVPLQKTLVDLNQIIRDSLYFIEMSASRGKVEVRTELAEGLPAIMADPQHLKQVIVNLVVNGIHAMPGGGVLTLQTQSFNDDVYLLVSDTGVGMAPEVLRQIFNPFFTTKDVDQGTGLGLAVVHGIVHAHGGIIEVESETGRGTRFEITFPCSHGLPKNQDSDDK